MKKPIIFIFLIIIILIFSYFLIGYNNQAETKSNSDILEESSNEYPNSYSKIIDNIEEYESQILSFENVEITTQQVGLYESYAIKVQENNESYILPFLSHLPYMNKQKRYNIEGVIIFHENTYYLNATEINIR